MINYTIHTLALLSNCANAWQLASSTGVGMHVRHMNGNSITRIREAESLM
jgi:hypothetical protein